MPSYLKTRKPFLFSAALSGILLIGISQGAVTPKRNLPPRRYLDSHHNHNHSYPARGQFVDSLPPGNRSIFWKKERYHFFNGVWYRPVGRQFLVVSPPVGLVVPVLPPFITTFWVRGLPYYYANEVYYTQGPVGYVIAEPPKGEVSRTPPGRQLYIYPRHGQSEQTQERDLHECQTWAVNRTHYDPLKPQPDMTEVQINKNSSEYQRAIGACLEAKGYAVK